MDHPTSPSKDPNLPPLGRLGDIVCPRAPQTIADMKLSEGALVDLAAKFAHASNRFAADTLCDRLRISPAVAAEVCSALLTEGWIETTMSGTKERPIYRITDTGRRHAERALEVNSYLGPAPVSLDAYAAMLRWEFAHSPEVKPSHVTEALSNLVLTDNAIELAGLAASSGRSLFVYGPSGNGKSSIGRQIHKAMQGDIWVPYCLSVRGDVIRLFDEQVHQRIESDALKSNSIDQRWVRTRRPMVVVGGELTLEYLDLVYSPALRYYEAPPHLKANGGIFLVDDFGRERVSPHQLLNRFITPMEHQVDYFTMTTGQKICVPLRQVLIIATNLGLETVTDPAFLRRMGYRLLLEAPTPEQYAKIFKGYAAKQGVAVPPGILEGILERYQKEERELRACEPRDLIERSRDICRFRGKPLELTPEVIGFAWTGYFGTQQVPKGKQAEASGIQIGKLGAAAM
jgi:DNA-binding MarR family transcriptional regulator